MNVYVAYDRNAYAGANVCFITNTDADTDLLNVDAPRMQILIITTA